MRLQTDPVYGVWVTSRRLTCRRESRYSARRREWVSAAIKKLLNDPALRRRMGAAGRKKVEEQYSLQVWGPRVAQMLRSVVEKKASG